MRYSVFCLGVRACVGPFVGDFLDGLSYNLTMDLSGWTRPPNTTTAKAKVSENLVFFNGRSLLELIVSKISPRQGPLEDGPPETLHQQFLFGNFLKNCGGERGSLGYLPRVGKIIDFCEIFFFSKENGMGDSWNHYVYNYTEN